MSMELLKRHRFVGLFRHIPPHLALQAAEAMYEGGVRLFEITFDPSGHTSTQETCQMIHTLRSHFGREVGVGAGTVLTPRIAMEAHGAGAEFIISPGTNAKCIEYAKGHGMLAIPGAHTPTEIMNAWDMGADVVKIFPIGPDDEGYLRNVMGPLSHIPFMVTGGIRPDTIEKFLAMGPLAVAAGASIVTRELVEQGAFDTIRQNALAHTEKIR